METVMTGGVWVFLYQLICLVGNHPSLDKYASVAASPALAFKRYANIGRNYFFYCSIVILPFWTRNRLRWGSKSALLAHVLTVWPAGKHKVIAPALLYTPVPSCRRPGLR